MFSLEANIPRRSGLDLVRFSPGCHLLSIYDLTQADIAYILCLARHFESVVESRQPLNIAQGRVLGALFCEPSTRTSCSFQAAMLRLGGQVCCLSSFLLKSHGCDVLSLLCWG